MPDVHALLVFAAASIVLAVVPGPAVIYIVTRSVRHGRTAGLVSTLGVEAGNLVHVAAAAVGLSALLASSAAAFNVVRYAGAAYLVFLGVRVLLGKEDEDGSERPAVGRRRLFWEGAVVSALTPRPPFSSSPSCRSSSTRRRARSRSRRSCSAAASWRSRRLATRHTRCWPGPPATASGAAGCSPA
jgi:hypothetical protein